ncbi:MAG: D-alanyl-D-alanine carboxypeptidase/D-alanyl-D-alanine-endopeptidase [Gemmatimonadota bacterium]
MRPGSIHQRAWIGGLILAALAVLAPRDAAGVQATRAPASAEAIAALLDPVVRGRGGAVGVAVYAVTRNRALYLYNAETPLLPASNMKLYTTAAALDRLGPDFQYTTSLYADGPLRSDGTLDGNLILAGRGDPTLSGRFYGDSATYVFDRLAAGLRSSGVRRIGGELLGDASYFDDELIGPGWESGNLLWWYGARVSALAFNDNVVTIEVRPGGSIGAPPQVRFIPQGEGLVVDMQATTVSARGGRAIGIGRRADIGGYEIRGRIALGSGPLRYVVAFEEPAVFAMGVFRDRLERAGIRVAGQPRVIYASRLLPSRPRRLLASHTSPRLIEIVRVINKHSQNHFAEQVLKTLGAVFRDDGSFDDGAAVVEAVLRELGVGARSFYMADGSGLSRRNLVTARATAELLVAMQDHAWFEEYYDSLLIAGSDGDPRRLDAPAARGNVHSKTGTLRGASALSGYVTTRDGERLAFSVISNNLPQGKGGAIAIEDAVAERLAGYTSFRPVLLEAETGDSARGR